MKFKSLISTLWEFTQVDHRGRYSTEGILELTTYANETSWLRVMTVLVTTPLPCLIVTILIDVLPLADPSKGITANLTYLLRLYYTYLVMTFLAIHQFHVSVPVLPYAFWRAIGITLVVAALCVAILYKLAIVVGFPLPFSLIIVAFPWILFLILVLALEWARKVLETPGATRMLSNAVKLWMCQLSLVFTYPFYFYTFTTLSKEGKTAFAILLPFIKMFMKNMFARTVIHLRDDTPEVVVFNAELFNALFLSYCMQNSPSLWITLEIMLVDMITMAFSLRGSLSARWNLKDLESRINQWSSWESVDVRYGSTISSNGTKLSSSRRSTRLTTLDRASMMLHMCHHQHNTQIPPAAEIRMATSRISLPVLWDIPEKTKSNRKNALKSSVEVAMKNSSNIGRPPHDPVRLAKMFYGRNKIHPAFDSDENRLSQLPVRYIHKVQRLVYVAEFLLLLNYVEVVIPLVFCKYCVYNVYESRF
ncbi:unnamed protein product [Phytophthora fragariaefolia]|uniref:Unnamed protein product n=1 Tax=Phytophthora fragariaefolia TaxID=1490495 RepID=A0A9W6X9X8_9STRA|nr:unnamed protein product [Phytophthora fragariaefolia]